MSHSLCLPRAGPQGSVQSWRPGQGPSPAPSHCLLGVTQDRGPSASLQPFLVPRTEPASLRAVSLARLRQDWEGTATSRPARVAHATISAPPAQTLQDSQAPRQPGGSEPGHLCRENTQGPGGGPRGPSKSISRALTSRPPFQTALSQRTSDGAHTGLSSLSAQPPRPDPLRRQGARWQQEIGLGGLRPFPAAPPPGPCAGTQR